MKPRLLACLLLCSIPLAGRTQSAPEKSSLEAGVTTEYQVLNERAQLRWQRGEYDKALELLRQMAALRPDEPAPHYAIGQILGSDGPLFDRTEALRSLNACLRLATGESHRALRARVQGFVLDLEDGRKLSLGKAAAPAAAATATRTPGEILSVDLAPGIGLELAYVPAGRFRQGSPPGEPGRGAGEDPREVTLTRGFWMGRTEVTQRQWKALVLGNPSRFKGDDLPVGNVSWADTQDFLRALNARVPGGGFSLPTEAQWERACRAGADGPFAGKPEELGWFHPAGGAAPHPVARLRPNAWGLFDMHGNAWEWCQDWFVSSRTGPLIDPAGPPVAGERALRGGSFNSPAAQCRSAFRRGNPPGDRHDTVGFRVLRRE